MKMVSGQKQKSSVKSQIIQRKLRNIDNLKLHTSVVSTRKLLNNSINTTFFTTELIMTSLQQLQRSLIYISSKYTDKTLKLVLQGPFVCSKHHLTSIVFTSVQFQLLTEIESIQHQIKHTLIVCKKDKKFMGELYVQKMEKRKQMSIRVLGDDAGDRRSVERWCSLERIARGRQQIYGPIVHKHEHSCQCSGIRCQNGSTKPSRERGSVI